MKRLELYGVQELNAEELKCIQGGEILAYIAGAICGILYTIGASIDNNLASEEACNFQSATGGLKW